MISIYLFFMFKPLILSLSDKTIAVSCGYTRRYGSVRWWKVGVIYHESVTKVSVTDS